MITGISSSGGYLPQSLLKKVKTSSARQPDSPTPEVKPEAEPADLKAPEGDHKSLAREYNLFDLATRQFERILPQLELANSPVE